MKTANMILDFKNDAYWITVNIIISGVCSHGSQVYHNKILLHLVDHVTRLFETTVKGPRHDNESHLQLLDTDVWISREVPYRQWWRICKQEFS